MKLILMYEKKNVVESCISCLGSVINEVTKNFKLIRDVFKRFYGWMTKFQQLHQSNQEDPRLSVGGNLANFRRAMFIVGQLLRHFDFSKEALYKELQVSIERARRASKSYQVFKAQNPICHILLNYTKHLICNADCHFKIYLLMKNSKNPF